MQVIDSVYLPMIIMGATTTMSAGVIWARIGRVGQAHTNLRAR